VEDGGGAGELTRVVDQAADAPNAVDVDLE
jgi:hypothetical protein